LLAEGESVGILTRGYRGVQQSDARGIVLSDEVASLRARLGGRVQFGIGANRYAKGVTLERHGVEWLVLDDGFQHLQLGRDADIVLIDATDPFGGGNLLPVGRLREPKSGLARADVVVITRSERAPAVEAAVRRYTEAPIFYAQTQLKTLRSLTSDHPEPEPARGDWRGLKFFAFCAIGNPPAFFDDLRRWGMQVVGTASYRDHHRYSQGDAEDLERRANAAGAGALICTEKDVFNLRHVRFNTGPLYYCQITLGILNEDAFWRTVLATVERNRARVEQ
jgi:tetraacyldisaccharide 4'-kinase